MNSSLYLICQVLVFIFAFGLLGTIVFALKFAFKKLRFKADASKRMVHFVILGILFWLSILAIGAYTGFFKNFDTLPPRIMLAVIPSIILIISLLRSRLFKLILRTIPKSWLIYIQSFRIIMEVMLWLGFVGSFVPLQMTFLWLNQDIIVGITAILAGSLFFRRRYMRWEAILWNVFGVLLLFNIFLIGFFSAPSPFQVFLSNPGSEFIGNMPFIWIPGFIVPFALAMHLFSLKQLLRKY